MLLTNVACLVGMHLLNILSGNLIIFLFAFVNGDEYIMSVCQQNACDLGLGNAVKPYQKTVGEDDGSLGS